MNQKSSKGLAQLRTIAVVLTANCNLACTYCYQNAKRPRRMNWDTLRRAINLLLESDRDEVVLTFYGGEPLLEFGLVRRALDYVESSRPSGLSVDYWLLTNGTLLTARRAAFLDERRVRTQISMDGVAAAQRQRGPETFTILDRLLDRLKVNQPRWYQEDLSISMTVSPRTVKHLAEGVSYLMAKGLQQIGFSPVLTDTSEWRLDEIEKLREQFGRVFDLSLEHYRRTHETPVEVLRRYPETTRHEGGERTMCKATRGEELGVDVDGQAYGCAVFAESFQSFPGEFLRNRLQTMRLGHIGREDFGESLAGYLSAVHKAEIFHRKEAKYSSYGRCGDCRHLESCQFCPMAIGHIPGNSDPMRVPDFLCAFNQVCNEYRERFPVQFDLRSVLETARDVPPSPENLREFLQAFGA